MDIGPISLRSSKDILYLLERATDALLKGDLGHHRYNALVHGISIAVRVLTGSEMERRLEALERALNCGGKKV